MSERPSALTAGIFFAGVALSVDMTLSLVTGSNYAQIWTSPVSDGMVLFHGFPVINSVGFFVAGAVTAAVWIRDMRRVEDV